MKSAYTLIEIMVAISLIFVVISMGAFGLIQVNKNLELQNSYQEVLGFIKSIQNESRNSVLVELETGSNVLPKFYGLQIYTDSLDGDFRMKKIIAFGENLLSIQTIGEGYKLNSKINLSVDCGDDLVTMDNEYGFMVVFERLSQNMSIPPKQFSSIDTSQFEDSNFTCQIKINHNEFTGANEKYIFLDILKNKIYTNENSV